MATNRLKAEPRSYSGGRGDSGSYLDLRDSKGKAVNPEVPDVDRKTAEKAAEQINSRKGPMLKNGGVVRKPAAKKAVPAKKTAARKK